MISVMQMLANCWCLIYHAVTLTLGSPAPYPDEMGEMEDDEMDDEMGDAPSKPRVNPEEVSKRVVNFFNPVTCHPRENEDVAPCPAGAAINKSLCLKHQCCVSSKRQVRLDCYAPLKDRGQRILRICGIGFLGVVLVAFLPFCCLFVEKSPCANPLRRAPKELSSSDEDGSDEGHSSSIEDNSSSDSS